MCVPAAALPALALASGVIGAAGSLYAGAAAKAQGKYEQRVADRNADLANEQARDALERGQRDRQILSRRVAQTKGAQAAAMAANGVDLGFGSALETQRDTAMLAGEDFDALNRNILSEARGFEINASNYRSQGKAARMRGNAAMVGSVFDAAGSILGSATQYGDLKKKYGG